MEKNGAKWFIENMENNRDLKIEDASTKTSVCMAQCKGSLLQIPGKINTVQMDGCTKTSMVVESCVASVDIINCKSCEIQVNQERRCFSAHPPSQILDWTPMITIDGCSGVIVYLSQRCVDEDVAIVTSKCSELNVVLPAKTDAEDPTELPIPEQRFFVRSDLSPHRKFTSARNEIDWLVGVNLNNHQRHRMFHVSSYLS
eukprot:752160-Hanusia_phi.AAC.1